MKHLTNVGLMLEQRRRLLANIKPTLGDRLAPRFDHITVDDDLTHY